MTGLFVILALVLLALYLNDAWRSLERVRGIARELCAREGVQFLDGSVVAVGVRVERRGGRWALVRRYRFEFATDGSQRHQGEILLGQGRVLGVSLQRPEGGRILDAEPGGAGESRE
jgi:hypothetical protein